MDTIETSLSRWFIWHLANSSQTYCYGNVNCWRNSRGGAGAAAAVQYISKVPINICFINLKIIYICMFKYIIFSDNMILPLILLMVTHAVIMDSDIKEVNNLTKLF